MATNEIPTIERDPRVRKAGEVTPTETPQTEAPENQVTLASGQTSTLSDAEMALRNKNLGIQEQVQENKTLETPKAEPLKAPTTQKVSTQADEVKEPSEREVFQLEQEKSQVKIQEEQKKLEQFRNMMQSGASQKELASFVNENQALRAEMNIAVKNFYKDKKTFDFQQKYATANPETLYNAYINSDIVVWSKEYNTLPQETRQAFEQYKAEKDLTLSPEQTKISLQNDANKVLSFDSYLTQFESFFGTDIKTQYENLTNWPEISTKRTEVENLANELGTIQDELINIEDTIRAKYEWTGRSSSFINAVVAKEQRVLNTQYRNKSVQYQNSLASFQDMKADIDRDISFLQYENQQKQQAYQIALSQYNTDRARMDNFAIMEFEQQNQLLAEQRALDNQKALYQFQADLEAQNQSVDRYEIGRDGKMYALVNGQAMEVKGFGWENISFSEEQELYTTQVLDNWDGTFTQIKAYKDGKAPAITTYDAQGNIVKWTPDSISDIIAQCRVEWQCGQWANDYAQSLWLGRIFGDSYDSKSQHINSQTPEVWGFAIWNPVQWDSKEYGHVGIVTGYNPVTKKVTITDWNWNGDEKQQTHEVDLSAITYNGWFYNPSIMVEEYSKEVKDWGDNIIWEVWGAKITSIKDDNLRSQVSSYIAEKMKEQPNQNIATLKSKLQIIEELEKHPWLWGAIGLGTKWLIPWTASASFMAKLEQLDAVNFMEGIQGMKGMGSLSNAEGMKVSASISSIWNTRQSEASWKKELASIKNTLLGRIEATERDAWVTFDIYGRPTDGYTQNLYTTPTQIPQTGSLLQSYENSYNVSEYDNILNR